MTTIYDEYQSYLTDGLGDWQLQNTDIDSHTLFATHTHQSDIQSKRVPESLFVQMQVNNFDSGVVLSRVQGRGQAPYTSFVKDFEHNFSLFIMLEGCNNFVINKRSINVNPNQLWLVKGHFQDVHETIRPTNGQLGAIHLDFSLDRLQRWQEDGILQKGLFALQYRGSSGMNNNPFTLSNILSSNTQICQLSSNILPIANMTKKILSHPYQLDSLSHIELESASLDLTAKLLHFCLEQPISVPQRLRSQIDETVDIIYQEFDQALTINGLAKRVGLNECYLKQHFKSQTGDTIPQFIRKLRMQQALSMLSDGNKTIKETMYFVGYQHAGHFNEIFKRHYGFSPSDVKRLF